MSSYEGHTLKTNYATLYLLTVHYIFNFTKNLTFPGYDAE